MIKVISGENCVACRRLLKFLQENEIDHEIYHKDSGKGSKILKKYGKKSIPFTIISDGAITTTFVGFGSKVKNACLNF